MLKSVRSSQRCANSFTSSHHWVARSTSPTRPAAPIRLQQTFPTHIKSSRSPAVAATADSSRRRIPLLDGALVHQRDPLERAPDDLDVLTAELRRDRDRPPAASRPTAGEPGASATSASRTASHACSGESGSSARSWPARSSQPRATAARPPKRIESQASAPATRAAPRLSLPRAVEAVGAPARVEGLVGVVEPPVGDAGRLERLGVVVDAATSPSASSQAPRESASHAVATASVTDEVSRLTYADIGM